MSEWVQEDGLGVDDQLVLNLVMQQPGAGFFELDYRWNVANQGYWEYYPCWDWRDSGVFVVHWAGDVKPWTRDDNGERPECQVFEDYQPVLPCAACYTQTGTSTVAKSGSAARGFAGWPPALLLVLVA